MKRTRSSFCRRQPSWDSLNIPTWSSCTEWSLWENPWVQYTLMDDFEYHSVDVSFQGWSRKSLGMRLYKTTVLSMIAPLTENGSTGAYAPWWFERLSDQEETSVCTMLMTELNSEVLSFLHINLTVLGSLCPHQCHRCAWTSAVR